MVGPALRRQGFLGSGSTWRRRNPHGDWAVVNVQKSAWGDREAVSAYVNLAIVPEAVRRFTASTTARPLPRQPTEWHGVWRARLDPLPTDHRWGRDWDFGDGTRADDFGSALVDRLDSYGVPVLERLLDRDRFLSMLRDPMREKLELGRVTTWSADSMAALIMSDDGPGRDLDGLLEKLRTDAAKAADPEWGARVLDVVGWIEARLAS
nr:DUF4304 domain-containing protein [Frondihabitans sp. 762G35]